MRIESVSIGVVTVIGTVVGGVGAVVFACTLVAIENAPRIATQATSAMQAKAQAIRADVARRINSEK